MATPRGYSRCSACVSRGQGQGLRRAWGTRSCDAGQGKGARRRARVRFDLSIPSSSCGKAASVYRKSRPMSILCGRKRVILV